MKRRWSAGFVACLCGGAIALMAASAEAKPQPKRRGPSPEQIKKMQEEMAYRQREYQRVQAEVAAKNLELVKQFDENGDGRLFGVERSKYDKHLQAIRDGKVPNPLADIKPLGQGPRDPKAAAAASAAKK